MKDYYAILDVAPDASVTEIKRAYRQLAREYHPDLNPGDKEAEEQFKDIVEAYDILCDDEKRQQYDEYAAWWRKKNRRGVKVGSRDDEQYGDFNSFVEQVLGRRSNTNGGSKTPRKSRRVPIDEADAYRPGTTRTAYTVQPDGRSPTPPKPRKRDVEARLTLPLEKAYRGGRERIRLEDGRALEVELPTGIIDGQQMRLRGQGLGGGDLYLKIKITPHPIFEIQGLDVFCRIPITPSEAVLGGAIEVPTLDGLVKMSVPPGVKSGKRLRLANKGYPQGEERGDQLVELQIVVPSAPTDEEKALYEQLRQVETFKPRKDLMGK